MWMCLDVLKDFPSNLAGKNDGGDGGVEESVWGKKEKEERSEPAKEIKW